MDWAKATRISCDLSWLTVVENKTKYQDIYMGKHFATYNNDYDYLGNFNINFNFYSVAKEEIGFNAGNKFNKLIGKRLEINDDSLNEIKSILNFTDCAGTLQNLEPGNLVLSHYDVADFTKKEKIDTQYYNYLATKHQNINYISIDKVFNIAIVFLESWSFGQAFMIGRQAFTNWKSGDIISFPWYMLHSTVNAGKKDRHIIYMAGSII